MIPTSRLAAAIALLVALGVHASPLILRLPPQVVQIQGGAPVTVTALGDAFSDMVAGTSAPVEAELNTAETPLDTAQKPEPSEITPTERPPQETSQTTPPVTKTGPTEATTLAEATPTAATLVETVTTAPAPTIQPTQPTAQPEPDAQPTTALTYNEPVAVPATRPVARAVTKPVQVPDKPVEPSIAQAAPVKPTKPIKPVVKQPPKPKPKSRQHVQGNSDQNAKRGTATGTQPKAKAKSGTSDSRSSAQGNAEKSNYIGKVVRKIRRKASRLKTKGAAKISFGISATGSLTRVSVSQSSGSARFDQLAIQQVRRTAPFPAPPGGAPLGLAVTIESK